MANETEAKPVGQCYYFGCHKQPGHYLWTESGSLASRIADSVLPFRHTILDAGLLPKVGNQVEGHASLSHIGKWTIISFWDRSVDKRGACNSSFVIPKTLEFSDAIEVSKERFPWVWSRLTFDVVLAY